MHSYYRLAVALSAVVSFSCFAFGVMGLVDPEALGWSATTGIFTKVILVALIASPQFVFRPVLRHYRHASLISSAKPAAMEIASPVGATR